MGAVGPLLAEALALASVGVRAEALAEASSPVMVLADEEQLPTPALALALASGWMRAEARAEARAGAFRRRAKPTAVDRAGRAVPRWGVAERTLLGMAVPAVHVLAALAVSLTGTLAEACATLGSGGSTAAAVSTGGCLAAEALALAP